MKKLFIFLCLSASLSVAAQNEQPTDSTLLHRLPTEMEGVPQISPPSAIAPRQEMPVATTLDLDSTKLNITIPEYIPTLPWMDVRMGKMVNSYDPYVMDYERYGVFELTRNSALSTFSTYNTYSTMGTIIQAGANIIYRPNERWELNGGMYTSKYTLPSRMHGAQFDIGLSVSAAYRINDRLRIRFFGQYSGYGKQNSLNGYMNPMYPQSNYGAILELKVNDYLDIQGGVERVYNPTKMKWETIPIVCPVIHLKRKK